MSVLVPGADDDLIERAVERSEFDSREAFVREATERFAADILDETGQYECPYDDCSKTFPTLKQRRGHLGAGHVQERPDGEFWCGYCGYGPTTWHGVNAHHGQSSHDGDPVRLDDEPTKEGLIAPEDVPDHKDPELLEELYNRHDGCYSEMCRAYDFEVGPGRVRHYLIEFGIHEPTPQSGGYHGLPDELSVERLEALYKENDGNMSAVHRALDAEATYPQVRNWLTNAGIHDRDVSGPQNQSSAQEDSSDAEDGTDEPEQVEPGNDLAEDQQAFVLEWGRSGPPKDGTYHTNPDCRSFSRSDSDRDVVPLPRPRDELEADDDWGVCGHCTRDYSESDSSSDDAADRVDVPEELLETVTLTDPDAASSFDDLVTPDWLAEASFHVALDMSNSPEEFADALGWGEPDELRAMVVIIDEVPDGWSL